MDANQRSETNNQTNNGANEKWTPGSKGNTTSGPNDHTYPNGETMQQAQPGMGPVSTQQADLNPGASEQNWFDRDDSKFPATGRDLHGGSMQSQQTGGSGPQQGITDSHQRQMEIHSEAWGLLEQPVGHRPPNSGTDLKAHPANQQGNSQAAHAMNPQNAAQPELQGGSLGHHHHHHHYDAPQVVGESPLRTSQADLSATPHEEFYGRDHSGMHAPRNAMQAGTQNMQSGIGEQQSRQSQRSNSAEAGGAQSGSMQSGSAPSGSAPWGSAPSGSAPSGSMQSGGTESGSMRSNSMQSGGMQSGAMQSGGMQSGAVQSGAVQSGAVQSGAVQSGGMQSGGTQPGNMQSGSMQSGSMRSDSMQSGGTQPDSMQSSSPQSGGAQPGGMQSGNMNSGGAQAGSVEAGSSQSDQREAGSEQRSGGHSQYSADRDGSQTGEHARDIGTEDVHLSNDVSGGLPRSPGNSGPRSDNPGWKPGGSMQRDPAVHESNDTVGGLPRSPAGANQLAGDRKMDDDTGFSRK